MRINVYGAKSFNKQMKSLINESNLGDILEEIKDVSSLESKIKEFPNDIYLIDSDKIISKNIITNKLNFLKPKDSIYKETLQEYGIDDMCFNSNEALLSYIINKIDSSDVQIDNNNAEDEKSIDVDLTNEIIQDTNMNDITSLDDIIEDDLLNALSGKQNEDIKSNKTASKDEVLNEKIELSSDNIDDVSELLKQLLNNKTLELSIKIKDS